MEGLNTRVNALVAENAAQAAEIRRLSEACAAQGDELNTLTSLIAIKDATIAQLQQARTGGSQAGEVSRLTRKLKELTDAYNTNVKYAEEMQAKEAAAALKVENLQNPMAQGSTLDRILDVLKAAACATKSGPAYTWTPVECEACVRTMVEGLVAVSAGAGRARTVNDMVAKVWCFMFCVDL